MSWMPLWVLLSFRLDNAELLMMAHGQERSMSCLLKEVGVRKDEPPGPLLEADIPHENFAQSSRRMRELITVRLYFLGYIRRDAQAPRRDKHETKNWTLGLYLSTRDESTSEIGATERDN
jgi:hypothetical protein